MRTVPLKPIPLAAGLALFAALSIMSMRHHSAAWDETHYLGLGNCLFQGRWDVPSANLHPPLSHYIQGLPLLFCNLDESCFEDGQGGIRRGQCLMAKSDPGGDDLLLLARLPTVGIGIFLGVLIYLWAAELHGPRGGLLSLFLYCLSPNVLTHAGLITPDLCLTAFGFAAVYGFWRHVRSPSISSLLFSSVALGLTLLSKHAGLIFVPILATLATVERARTGVTRGPQTGFMTAGPILHFAFALVGAGFVLWAGCLFDLSLYLSGLETQNRMVGEGLPAFLYGNVSPAGGWWYYYLLAFLVKVPIPAMVLTAIGLIMAVRGPLRGSWDLVWLLLPVAGVFAAFSFLTKVNIGIRYVLPAFPFLFILAGGASFLWQAGRLYRGKLPLLLLTVWLAAETVAVYPHFHAYFNQMAGGPKNGYRFLVDSNLDWGQDLKGLKRYMDENGLRTIKLSYFGTVDPNLYGMEYEPLPSFAPLPPGQAPVSLKKGDLMAISATNLYPLYVNLGHIGEWLRSSQPVAQVGFSILIYRVDAETGFHPQELENQATISGQVLDVTP